MLGLKPLCYARSGVWALPRVSFSTARRLQSSQRCGIVGAGNFIRDLVKIVDKHPRPGMLNTILTEREGTGGSPYNVLIGIQALGLNIPLQAVGLLGKDHVGDDIIDHCRSKNIDVSLLQQTSQEPTSYTIVTSVSSKKERPERTFCHRRGANSLFSPSHVPFPRLSGKMFHIGYALLLDAMDRGHPVHGTVMAGLLKEARIQGFLTSVDIVSEDSDRYQRVVVPLLPHLDYLILNELEAGLTTGHQIRRDDKHLDVSALRQSVDMLIRGSFTGKLVCVHFPEGGYLRTSRGEEFFQPSLDVPLDYIVGTVGCGDAFCAGLLTGIHEGWDYQRCLKLAILMATVCLSDLTCTGTMTTLESTLELAKQYPWQDPVVV